MEELIKTAMERLNQKISLSTSEWKLIEGELKLMYQEGFVSLIRDLFQKGEKDG